MEREIHSRIARVDHLECKAYTTTQTPTNGVDLQGYNAVDFLIALGQITSANASPEKGWKFALQESDSQSTGFTAVTDANQVSIGSSIAPITTPDANGVFLEVYDPTDDQKSYRIGYRGKKRYARIVATAVNTPGSTPLYIGAVLGDPLQLPTADA